MSHRGITASPRQFTPCGYPSQLRLRATCPCGAVNLKQLIMAEPATLLADIMDPDVISVPAGIDQEHAVVALSLFIPLLIGTGGNAGSQTTSTIIRALAIGDIDLKDVLVTLWHELRAGLLLGLGDVSFCLCPGVNLGQRSRSGPDGLSSHSDHRHLGECPGRGPAAAGDQAQD